MKTNQYVAGLAAGMMFGMGASAQTSVILLQPIADSTIFFNSESPTANLSSSIGDAIWAGRTQARGSTTQRALIRFDLSEIPCGATIQNVSLTLTLIAAGSGVANPSIGLHRLNKTWGEGPSGSFGGSGAPAGPGDPDWYFNVNPTQSWSTPGGDFVAVASASRLVSGVAGPYVWNSTPALVADVTSWLSNPASNHGWLLLGNEVTAGSTRKFASRENVPSSRPVLTIEYLPGCVADIDDGSGSGQCDGGVTIDDLLYYLIIFDEGDVRADVDDGSGTGTPDGGVTIDDLLYFLARFDAGC